MNISLSARFAFTFPVKLINILAEHFFRQELQKFMRKGIHFLLFFFVLFFGGAASL